jgi:antitoxin (DNA-binding transcriptional repressor) of toxin-antitoxin stability system
MKTISIRELHNRTGELAREALRRGEIRVTDNGHVVASIMPPPEAREIP